MTDRLRWDEDLTKVRSGRSIFRSPLRLSLAIGAVVMAIGALLPWAEGMVGFQPKRFGGFDGAADGLIMATLALVLFLFARNREFLYAPDGARRYAPLLIGLACVALWVLGRQSALQAIAGWENDDGHGSIVIGYWIAGIGVAIVAVVGSYATLRHHEGQTSDPVALVRLPQRTDVVPLASAAGAIIVGIAGANLALAVFPPAAVSAPLLFLVGIGLVAGWYTGRALGRLLVRLLT
jgi:hypothetical protein